MNSCTKRVCHATARDNVCMKREGMLMKAWIIPHERPLYKGHCVTVSCVICIKFVDAHGVHAVSRNVTTCHSYYCSEQQKRLFFSLWRVKCFHLHTLIMI